MWYITKFSNNTLVIQNAGNGAFFPRQNGHGGNLAQVKTQDNVAFYKYSDAYEKGVLLYQEQYKINNTNIYLHCNNGDTSGMPLSYWEGASTDGKGSACLFTFYAATLSDAVTSAASTNLNIVNYVQQIDGVATGTTNTYVAEVGSATSNPWANNLCSDFYTPSVAPSTVPSDGSNIIVNYQTTSTPCITFSTTDNTTYYSLKVRGAGEKWVSSYGDEIATNQTISTTTVGANDLVGKYTPQICWSFEKSGLGLKIRNASGKYIKVDGTGNTAKLADEGSVFYLKGAPSNASSSNFSLQYATNCYLGDHSGGNTRIGTWTSASNPGAANDKGSGYTIVETYVLNDLKTALEERLISTVQPTSLDANILRVATTDKLEEAKTAAAAATTLSGMIEAYNTAYSPIADANAYYRIKNMNSITKAYPSSEDIFVGTDGTLQSAYNASTNINRTISRKSVSDNLVAQLWKLEAQSDGTYKIRNANNNCLWSTATSNVDMPVNTSSGGDYRLLAVPTSIQTHVGNMADINDGVSTFQLTLNGHSFNAYGGDDANNISIYDNHDDDKGNYWQFIKVTEIPVTISAAKYATVGFPFNTKVTTEGVKVFYGKKAENGAVSLTEVEDKIIPANQGAILYNESGATTATLEITDEGGTYDNNCLTATTAGRTGYTTLTTYGLALSNATNEACFKLNSLTTVPANKAFLNAENYSEATGNAMELKFLFNGGSITDINSATINNEGANSLYYDLQGRRVLYPAHGIFVNGKGEKIFIK